MYLIEAVWEDVPWQYKFLSIFFINKDNILVIIVTNGYFVVLKFTIKLCKWEESEKGLAKV